MLQHLLVLTTVLLLGQAQDRFQVIRQWKYVNFTWPNEETLRTVLSKEEYLPDNIIMAGIKSYEDYYYITLPRMKNGVPATLTRIPLDNQGSTAPPLEPFPSWEMNQIGDCNALQNVQNLEIDAKGQMWIIDGGRVGTLTENPGVKCHPKLVIFDITRNMTTSVYTFPEEVASFNGSYLYDLVIDSSNGGYAYITDNSGRDPGIIVYSLKENNSWKFRHPQTMRGNDSASQLRVGPVFINTPINIAGIALGPKLNPQNGQDHHVVIEDDRDVFYCPLSSLNLFSIKSSILRNQKIAQEGEYQGEVHDYGRKASQSIGMVMDNKGNLYYSLLSTDSIARWNIYTSFQTDQKVIGNDPVHLQWPNSFAFTASGNLTVLTNKLHKFITGKFDITEPNFRLITAHVGGQSYIYEEKYDYRIESTQSSIPQDFMIPEVSRSGKGIEEHSEAAQPIGDHVMNDDHQHDMNGDHQHDMHGDHIHSDDYDLHQRTASSATQLNILGLWGFACFLLCCIQF